MRLNNRTPIPINFASGMYILNIQTKNQLFQSKIVVK